MWAEEDFEPSMDPCLRSLSEPKDGQTYIMYHGTSKEAAKQIMANGFRRSSVGMLGRGVYVSRDLQKASRYPLDLPEHERVVLKLRVRVGRVKKIDYKRHPMQKTWHTVHGYDTAWCPPNCGMVKSGLEEDCVWDPKRITVINAIYPKPSAGSSGYTKSSDASSAESSYSSSAESSDASSGESSDASSVESSDASSVESSYASSAESSYAYASSDESSGCAVSSDTISAESSDTSSSESSGYAIV